MSEEDEKIITALEKGDASPQQQREAARVMRDLDRQVREVMELDQGD